MIELNLAAIIPCTNAEGPGRRFCVWVQGCLKRCPGCCNPHMQPLEARHIVECDVICEQIRIAAHEFAIDGVTILGGEPFLQAKGLAHLAKACRDEGLSVMVFSGYTLAELRALDFPFSRELLAYTDVLVDGPYIAELEENKRNWIGSRNQTFHYFSTVYSPEIERHPIFRRTVEIRVRSNGEIKTNGWPTKFL